MKIDPSLEDQIDVANKEIQRLDIDLQAVSPYYPLPDKLAALMALMDIIEDSIAFNEYIRQHALNPLELSLRAAQDPIPEDITDIAHYQRHIIREMKHAADKAISSFKKAYRLFHQD